MEFPLWRILKNNFCLALYSISEHYISQHLHLYFYEPQEQLNTKLCRHKPASIRLPRNALTASAREEYNKYSNSKQVSLGPVKREVNK
jgi:hypothetical protein